MLNYLFKKLKVLILVLVSTIMVLFFFYVSLPADFASAQGPIPLEDKIAIRHKLHLDESNAAQFKYWVKGLLKGNLGNSFATGTSINSVIGPCLKNTLKLNIISFLISLIIAIPIGIKSACKKYSFFDNLFNVISLIGISVPAFALAVTSKYFFTYNSTVFDIFTRHRNWNLLKYSNTMNHLILPYLITILINLATLIKYTRSSMLDVILQDYVRTARAKGLKENKVIYKHAFKNALLPITTIIGLSIPQIFAGSFFIEIVLGYPGIGPLSYQAVFMRDYPMMMGISIVMCLVIMLANLLTDICYRLIDPRIKFN